MCKLIIRVMLAFIVGLLTFYNPLFAESNTPGDTSFDIRIVSGWGLASVPVMVSNTNVDSVFPGHSGSVWTYSPTAGYVAVSYVEMLVGYWVGYPHDTTITVTGAPVHSYTKYLTSNSYSIFGSITDTVPVDSVIVVPPGSVSFSTDTLVPTGVCWISVSRPCSVTVRKPGMGMGIEEMNKSITPKFQLYVHPNPFSNKTVIRYSLNENRDDLSQYLSGLMIYDLSGRLVETTESNIIGENLKSGIYFLKAKNCEPVKVVKLR